MVLQWTVYGVEEGSGEGEDNPRGVLDLMKTYHISARLTFSNSMLEEEHLSDPKCNTLCRLFNEAGNNGVIRTFRSLVRLSNGEISTSLFCLFYH